jgi:hypothetical protein
VDLGGDPSTDRPVPPHVGVLRSVRVRGEKRPSGPAARSPFPRWQWRHSAPCGNSQTDERLLAGARWQSTGLVFATHLGTALDAGDVRKMF